jgi:hypothetical protein
VLLELSAEEFVLIFRTLLMSCVQQLTHKSLGLPAVLFGGGCRGLACCLQTPFGLFV